MPNVSIHIEDQTAARLADMAAANQQTLEALIETLVEDFADTDESRLAEYERTGYGIGHETATAWLRDLAAGEYRPCPK
jgi:predicted transcriptional regulator